MWGEIQFWKISEEACKSVIKRDIFTDEVALGKEILFQSEVYILIKNAN